MADEKKISGLTEVTNASSIDEFVVVNKAVTEGADASASGQTSKITLDNLRKSIFGGDSKLQISQPSTTIGGNDITKGAMLVGDDTLGIGIDNNEIIHTGNMLNIGTYINDSQSIDDNSGAIRFNPNKVEAMRITSDANVGIGTTSPDKKLTVAGGIHVTEYNKVHFTNTPDQVYINAPASNKFAIYTDNTKRMLVDENGNVGIGTSTPDAPLVVSGQVTATRGDVYPLVVQTLDPTDYDLTVKDGVGIQIKIPMNDGIAKTGAAIVAKKDTTTDEASNTALAFQVSNDDAVLDEAMRIASTGNVGIGTVSPTGKLSLRGGNQVGSKTNIDFHGDGNRKIASIYSRVEVTGDPATDGNAKAGSLHFMTTIDEVQHTRMTIGSDGNTVIGGTCVVRTDTQTTLDRAKVQVVTEDAADLSGWQASFIASSYDVDHATDGAARGIATGAYKNSHGRGGVINLVDKNGGQNYLYVDHLHNLRLATDNNLIFSVNDTHAPIVGAQTNGFDAKDLGAIRVTEANALEKLNELVVSDFEKDGVTQTGIVAQNMQKILPNSVSGGEEYEAVVEPAKGMVVANLGAEDEYVYDNDTTIEAYEAERGEIPGDAKFVETDAEKTETRNHSLVTSNDELIAMLVKAVQELSAKNDELSAKVDELSK